MSDALVLDARGVVVRYPGNPPVVAVNDVSVQVGAGETVALVGESGSGKSSLARAAAGIEKTVAGAVQFNGMPVTTMGIRRNNPSR